MGSVSEGLKDLLVTAGVGVFAAESGWGIFIGREPGDPETTITIYDTGGFPPNPAWLLDFPTAQIRVRGARNGYQAASQKIRDIKDALIGIDSLDLNGDRWVSITMPSDPLSLGFTEEDKPLFVANFNLIIEPGVTALTSRTALS